MNAQYRSYISGLMSPVHRYLASVNSRAMSAARALGFLGVDGGGRASLRSRLVAPDDPDASTSPPPTPNAFTTAVRPLTRPLTAPDVSL